MRHGWPEPEPPRDGPQVLLAFTVIFITSVLLSLGFFIYGAARSPAKAHDFYPRECCSGTDCSPIPSARVDVISGGYLIDGLHFVFESQARISPDGKYHGCFPTPAILRCFFAPKPSM